MSGQDNIDTKLQTSPQNNLASPQAATIVAAIDAAVPRLALAQAEISKVILGQSKLVELALVTLLAGGHGLLVGLPGLAKTKLVETIGTVLGLESKRVQFTPDLMPADILGSEVLEDNNGSKGFRFLRGPVFCQLLMADEINRASPRTQSALLQAMQEQEVSVAGVRHGLPRPFHVLATQNPLEQEGTYPLPEAQLDRFLCQIDVHYPDRDTERRILIETTGAATVEASTILSAAELMHIQTLVRHMPLGERVIEAILDVVRLGRADGDAHLARHIAWAPGPRAAQALTLAVRARALLQGRLAPSLEDVSALAEPVLKHRMALNFSARAEGMSVEGVIAQLVQKALK